MKESGFTKSCSVMRVLFLSVMLLVCLTTKALSGSYVTKSITVGRTAADFELYSGDKTARLVYWIADDSRTSCSIPETVTYNNVKYTVTAIGPNVLTGTANNVRYDYGKYLTSITIPSTVTTIPPAAFSTCTAVKNLYWRASAVTITQAHVEAMKSSLVTLTVNAPIGESAFLGFSKLVDVYYDNSGSGITSIGAEAFAYCVALKAISNNCSALKTVGDKAFYECKSLTRVSLNSSVLTSLGERAFMSCESLADIDLDKTKLIAIETQTFAYCYALKTASLPSTLHTIDNLAFYQDIGLETLEGLENTKVTTIGRSAFYNTGLTTVKFPSTLQTIGELTFWNSKIAGKVAFPNTLTSIGSEAFSNCAGVTEYDFAEGGTAELTIGRKAFSTNSSLTTVKWSSRCKEIANELFSNCRKLSSEVPSNIRSIGVAAYLYCESLPEVLNISNHCTQIGDNAFSGCNNTVTVNCFGPLSLFDSSSNWYKAFYSCTIYLPYDKYLEATSDFLKDYNILVRPMSPSKIYVYDKKSVQTSHIKVLCGNNVFIKTTGGSITSPYNTYDINDTEPVAVTTNPQVKWSGYTNNAKLQFSGPESRFYEYGFTTTKAGTVTMTGTYTNSDNTKSTVSLTLEVVDFDPNKDGVLNMDDAKAVADYSIGKIPARFEPFAADVNGDGVIDMRDANIIVNKVLNK